MTSAVAGAESSIEAIASRPGQRHALAGVRVLDLTTMWSGPYATRLLAQFGADVVKIESPTRLDGFRGQPRAFRHLNRDKRSLLLDLRQPESHELFLALAQSADVLVENFSPRVLRSFDLTYDVLRRSNPGLVMLSMPAYGTTGPRSDWIGFGWELEAMGGMAGLMRDAAGRPTTTGLPLADPASGAFGALAVLGAILRRNETRRGCHIDLAQRDVVLSLIGDQFASNRTARTAFLSDSLSGCFPCADGWVAVSASRSGGWSALAAAIDAEPRAGDTRAEGPVHDPRKTVARFTITRPRAEVVRMIRSLGALATVVAETPASAERAEATASPDTLAASLPDADREAVLADWLK